MKPMKKVKLSLSIVLVFAILATAMISPAYALSSYDMSASQWDTYWQGYKSDGKALYMAPGGNESEMNFAWLGNTECENPTVYVKSSLIGSYDEFTGISVKIDNDNYSYQVTVYGLLPNRTYMYYYSANDYTSSVNTFKTGKADGFSALFVSDVHISEQTDNPDGESVKDTSFAFHEIFTQAYNKDNDMSLVISAGDQADHGLLSEYIGLFSSPLMKKIPFAATCGNHDNKNTVYASVINSPNRYNKGQAIVPDKNGGDYYFVKGDVLFLFINSNWTSANDHYNFVKQAVEENSDVKWRVAVMHHDLYGGHHEGREDENRLLRLMFVPIFDEFCVDIVLTGHSHVYSRTHVMYGGKVSEDIRGQGHVTDAAGTVYITSGSTARPRGNVSAGSDALAYDFISEYDYIYNIMDFSYDTITINSYSKDNFSPFEVFTLEKTSNEGGHPNEGHNDLYFIVGNIGTLVSFVQTIIHIFETLFASIGIEF